MWKLPFTSTAPTLIHRITVLHVKDHRHVRKSIVSVGRAKISWRAWLSSQRKSWTWFKEDPIVETWSIKDCDELFFLLTLLTVHQKISGVWIHHTINSTHQSVACCQKDKISGSESGSWIGLFKSFATFVQVVIALLLLSLLASAAFLVQVSLNKLAERRHKSVRKHASSLLPFGCSCSPFTCCISKMVSSFTACASLWICNIDITYTFYQICPVHSLF